MSAHLAELHRKNPLVAGHPRPALRAASGLDDEGFAAMIDRGVAAGRLVASKDLLTLAGHEVRLSDDERRAIDRLITVHREAKLQPPDLEGVLASLGYVPTSSRRRKWCSRSRRSSR